MTIETITAQLDRISADSCYNVYKDVCENNIRIDVTINDCEGFDENWSEIERELVDEDEVIKVLEWLDQNADCVKGNYYQLYYFGEIIVGVSFESFDI